MSAPCHSVRTRDRLRIAVTALLGFAWVGAAPALAAFPDKPVRLVVPYRAGGSSDIVARLLSLRLTELWTQSIVIDNVPGSGSVFGTDSVARANPDGHTLLTGNATLAINEAFARKLPYHALRDLTPIGLVARQHMALVVSAAAPFHSVAQIIEAARGRQPALSYGSSAQGTVSHLAGELFRYAASLSLIHVGYSGHRESIQQLVANRVSCAMIPLPSAMPYVKARQVRVLALTGSQRAEALPDVPTIGETVAGYEVNNWIGILAPYGANVRLVRRINADLNSIILTPRFQEMLINLGYAPLSSTPGEFRTMLASDIERYSRVILAAGIALQCASGPKRNEALPERGSPRRERSALIE